MHNLLFSILDIDFFISSEIFFKALLEISFNSFIEFSSNSNTFGSIKSLGNLRYLKYPLEVFLEIGILEDLKINLYPEKLPS